LQHSGPDAACIEGQVHFMAKEKAKPASADEEIKAVKKKVVGKETADLDEVDPLAEVKALQKEEIDSEAISVIELRKAVRAKGHSGRV
jgi:hypothetical protein